MTADWVSNTRDIGRLRNSKVFPFLKRNSKAARASGRGLVVQSFFFGYYLTILMEWFCCV